MICPVEVNRSSSLPPWLWESGNRLAISKSRLAGTSLPQPVPAAFWFSAGPASTAIPARCTGRPREGRDQCSRFRPDARARSRGNRPACLARRFLDLQHAVADPHRVIAADHALLLQRENPIQVPFPRGQKRATRLRSGNAELLVQLGGYSSRRKPVRGFPSPQTAHALT